MAHFEIPENGEGITAFNIPYLGKPLTLMQWGGDAAGNQLALNFDPGPPAVELKIIKKMPAASTLFTVRGLMDDCTVTLNAFIPGTAQTYAKELTFNVLGKPVNHPGYTVDLLAQLAQSSSAKKVHLYNLVMTKPAPLLKQNTERGHYNCGDVSASYGGKLFGAKTSVANYAYYLPPTSDRMADLRFDANTMRLRINSIRGLLNQGVSVRVWLVHDDGFGTHITATDPTHYVTIVGYGEGKFLFIDPWPQGSAFRYAGGMYPPTDNKFFGEFWYDPGHLEMGIRKDAESENQMSYVIVGGPP